jgi:hypothetical protein
MPRTAQIIVEFDLDSSDSIEKTIQELNINNIEVFVNINGLCAYKEVDQDYISARLKAFLPTINLRYTTVEQYPFLKGLNAHYHVMNDHDYKLTLL